MITLQLERLNLNAPYFVWRDEDGDLFFKKTENKSSVFGFFSAGLTLMSIVTYMLFARWKR